MKPVSRFAPWPCTILRCVIRRLMLILQVDSFTTEPFRGNPAAVCFLEGQHDDAWLAANGRDYGWVNPPWAQPGGSRPEPWHWEFDSAQVSS
jgi:hypothetical protein